LIGDQRIVKALLQLMNMFILIWILLSALKLNSRQFKLGSRLLQLTGHIPRA
jgi:hypothetical protein